MSADTKIEQNLTPTRLDKHSEEEMLISWSSGESFGVPYRELRYLCPCAVCVDERTGERLIRREDVSEKIRPTGAVPVGRYAIQINWSDGHSTGIYHFERLYEICRRDGKPL